MITREFKRSFLSFKVRFLKVRLLWLKVKAKARNSLWFYGVSLVAIVLLTFLIPGARW